MPHWAGWVVVAVICAIAEMATPTFFIVWFGVGALAAAAADLIGLGLAWQIVAFVVVSTALVLSTKKLSARWLKKDRDSKTNVDALAGKPGVVIQAIPERGTGQVRVEGEVWTATSEGGEKIPAGVTIRVVTVTGVHLVVRAPD